MVLCNSLMLSTRLVLSHKVQIVLGSQLISEIHPLDAFVGTSLYYCQNIRKTVRQMCPFCKKKSDTFYSYMNVFNKL